MSGDDEFLARWAKRKQEARRKPSPEPPPPDQPVMDPEKSEAEVLEELGLPDPDTLGPGDDFKAFMAKVVPDQIRRRALRRLWGTNPALANLDELLDYGEDYTDKATVVANLQSAYQAGRGYLKKLPVEPEEATEAPSVELAADVPETPEPEVPSSVRPPEAPVVAEDAQAEDVAAEDAPEPADDRSEEVAEAPRRRMRFAFDDG